MTAYDIISSLTDRQQCAILNPCFEAEETEHPRFYFRHFKKPFDNMSSVLTCNVGLE